MTPGLPEGRMAVELFELRREEEEESVSMIGCCWGSSLLLLLARGVCCWKVRIMNPVVSPWAAL